MATHGVKQKTNAYNSVRNYTRYVLSNKGSIADKDEGRKVNCYKLMPPKDVELDSYLLSSPSFKQ